MVLSSSKTNHVVHKQLHLDLWYQISSISIDSFLNIYCI